jgi:hypothetical protein
MQEKEARKKAETESLQKQATMWQRETDEYHEIERERNDRQANINRAHKEVLKQQMVEKKIKKAKPHMNPEELAMNKRLLKEMRTKKQTGAMES